MNWLTIGLYTLASAVGLMYLRGAYVITRDDRAYPDEGLFGFVVEVLVTLMMPVTYFGIVLSSGFFGRFVVPEDRTEVIEYHINIEGDTIDDVSAKDIAENILDELKKLEGGR